MKKYLAPLMLLTLISAGFVTQAHAVESDNTSQQEVVSKLSINKATQAELETLPGIGPSKAEAIVEYRDQIGQFSSLSELTDVKGIGDKTLVKLSKHLTL